MSDNCPVSQPREQTQRMLNIRCSSADSVKWLDSNNVQYPPEAGASELRRLVYATMADREQLTYDADATDKDLHKLLKEHFRSRQPASPPPKKKKRRTALADDVAALRSQVEQLTSLLAAGRLPPVKQEARPHTAVKQEGPMEIDLTSDSEDVKREPRATPPQEEHSPGPCQAGHIDLTYDSDGSPPAVEREPSSSPPPFADGHDFPMEDAGPSEPRTLARGNRKGKRPIRNLDSDDEEDENPIDYYELSEGMLRPLMRQKGLPDKGSRARMAFALQKHEAGDDWVDEPVPDIPEDEITLEEAEEILARTPNKNSTYGQYIGYVRRIAEKDVLNDLCNPNEVKAQYLVPQLCKDGVTLKKKQPKTVGKLPDAIDCLLENMTEMEAFRLLFNNNLRNESFLKEAKAAKSKQELMMLFRELRDQYMTSARGRNETAKILRCVKDPELTEQQKAQCVLPTYAMLEDVWPKYQKFYWDTLRRTQPQDARLKRHRDQSFKDQLQLIFTCQEWLKLHLHINHDVLRNDLAKCRVDDPVIKKGQVYIDEGNKKIIFYCPNKTGTQYDYRTLINVDREETWEMLMEMVRVQKLLGRKHVFCNTYRCNMGEKKGRWLRQSENYYGQTFSAYFGKVFKTKDGKFSPRMLRTLATCEQNVRDNVPQAYELPYKQAKGKNHSVLEQLSNNYNKRAVPAYAEAEYSKTKAAAEAAMSRASSSRSSSPEIILADDEDDEYEDDAATREVSPLPAEQVFDTSVFELSDDQSNGSELL